MVRSPTAKSTDRQAKKFQDRINWARSSWFAGIGLSGLLMLFSHQNCAPASNASGSTSLPSVNAINTSGTANGAGSKANDIIITDGSTATLAVSFAEPQTELSFQSGLAVVQGICSTAQEGSVLNWSLSPRNPDGSLGSQLLTGVATCTGGAFEVELTETSQLVCGDNYELTSQFGFVTPGQTIVSYPCTN